MAGLDTISYIEMDAEIAETSAEQAKFSKTLRVFDTYLQPNARSIPNYGERYRAGEPISSPLAESAVNQVISRRTVKKQQMRWRPRGATSYSRSAPEPSMTTSPATSPAGTPASRTRPR